MQMHNTSKRLPIVFCLDVSPSMGWQTGYNCSSMDLLNASVANFIKELKKDAKARTSTEISFVCFSTNIEVNTPFESINTMQIPTFRPVREGGTQMAQAVLLSIEKLEQRRRQLENLEIPYYAPFLVLVTDGNPDRNDNLAQYNQVLELVRRHCNSHIGASEIIIPFIIGVGSHIDAQTLNNYSAGFTRGYFPINGTADSARVQFNKVFQMIGNSTKKSIHLNGTAKEIIETIQVDMNDLLSEIVGE